MNKLQLSPRERFPHGGAAQRLQLHLAGIKQAGVSRVHVVRKAGVSHDLGDSFGDSLSRVNKPGFTDKTGVRNAPCPARGT